MKILFKFILAFFLQLTTAKAQIGNYVSNGSFESLKSHSLTTYYSVVEHWRSIDTNKYADYLVTSLPPISNCPYAYGFQYPRTGNNFISSTSFCPVCTPSTRGYPRNRLKNTLVSNTTYCVKFHVNVTNVSTFGIDGIGAYFGNSTLDTIKKCTVPLIYLTPQIQNPNIIADTLNWVAITGTFVANGTEKYLVLGNFKSDAATNTIIINPPSSWMMGTDISFDDVSVIEMNLPAYAGIDKSIKPGDSTFIGRESDFAIDPGCTWFKLPEMTPLDTVSGMWVKPTVTTTYVVKQILDCSSEKWDTVVVYMNLVGLEKLKIINEELKIYPVPANDFIELKISNLELLKDFKLISIYNNLGALIREEELKFENNTISIKTIDIPDGVYSFQLKSNNSETVTRRFVISR